jgi:hypothetical protein
MSRDIAGQNVVLVCGARSSNVAQKRSWPFKSVLGNIPKSRNGAAYLGVDVGVESTVKGTGYKEPRERSDFLSWRVYVPSGLRHGGLGRRR